MPLLLTDSNSQTWQVGVTDQGAYTLDEVVGPGQASVLLEDGITGNFFTLFAVPTAGGKASLEVDDALSGTPVVLLLTSPSNIAWQLVVLGGAISTIQYTSPTANSKMILVGLYNQLTSAAPAVQSVLGKAPADQVFIDLAMKGAARPYLVLTLIDGPPAEASLDGVADLIEGEIQFDAYADTPQDARKLSRAVRDYLMKTFNAGALPDGTTIQFVDVSMDHHEPFEQGGTSYVYRALLRLKAFYTEGP